MVPQHETIGNSMEIDTGDDQAQVIQNASGTSSSSSYVDEIVLKYLESKGYLHAAQTLQRESSQSRSHQKPQEAGPSYNPLDLAQTIGLKTEACTANHILFYGLSSGEPSQYEENYAKLMEWICNSLEMYKTELYAITFPIFVHIYLEMIAKKFTLEANAFFTSHAPEHTRLFGLEIRKLALITSHEQLQSDEYARHVLHRKFHVRMSMLSFELLNCFLRDSEQFLILCMINDRMSITVHENYPLTTIQTKPLAEADENGFLPTRDDPTSDLTTASDRIARQVVQKKVTSADTDAVQILDSTTDEMKRMVFFAGGKLNTPGSVVGVDELNAVALPWGVLPPRKTPPSSSIIAKDSKEKELGIEDDKRTTVTSEKGPIPNYKDPYNAEILEKLIMRQSKAAKDLEQADARARVHLGKAALPSAACFTFVNTHRGLNCIEFSRDATMVAAGFEDSSIRVWRNDLQPLGTPTGVNKPREDLPEKHRSAILHGHAGPVYATSFSPDNRFLLSSSADSTIRLWSLASRSNVVCYRAHHYPVWNVKFSPLGYYFASSSLDRTARLWSTDRMQPLRIFAGHLSDVNALAFHPNCNYLATGSSDKSVRLWDVQTGQCMRIFTQHHQSVDTLAFSPNGRLLVSAGKDAFVNVWDLASGKCLDSLRGGPGRVHTLDFSQDGQMLATGHAEDAVCLWDMSVLGTNDETNDTPPARMFQSSKFGSRLPPSSALLKTWHTKHTPVYQTQFTPRNLLLVGGPYDPPVNLN